MRIRIPLINLSSHGGIRILVELANAFASRGFEVEFLIPPGRNSSVYRLDAAVRVREIGIGFGSKILDYALFLLILPFHLRGGLTVANFFVTYFPCRLGSLLWGSRLLYFVQDIESKYAGLVGGILNRVCEATYRSRRMVAANSYLAAALEERGHRPFETIQIGPSEAFYGAARREERKYRLMAMPRHEAWKRMDRFEAICALLTEVSPAEILCVGQDAEILSRLAERGFATCKPGSDAELVDCYEQAQVFLLTSDREGFGLPPLEAMARGTPVVSFRCGGPDLYIRDGENSFLVDDAAEAAERIRRLWAEEPERIRMAAAAQQTALGFRLSEGLERFVACAGREREER